MYRLFRAATLAAIPLCLVAAAKADDIVETVTALPAIAQPLPPEPVVEPLAGETLAIDPPATQTAPVLSRATSLSQLVARHDGAQPGSREAECLAGAVYFESKGEPLDGQLAVAQTIINRAQSGRFPSSYCGVVMQRGQFSFVRGGGFPPIAKGSRGWREAVAIAHIAHNDLWSSSVDNAMFFHARHVSPRWRLKRLAAVGNHVFYR